MKFTEWFLSYFFPPRLKKIGKIPPEEMKEVMGYRRRQLNTHGFQSVSPAPIIRVSGVEEVTMNKRR